MLICEHVYIYIYTIEDAYNINTYNIGTYIIVTLES